MLYLATNISTAANSWFGLVWQYILILVFIAGLAYFSTLVLARYYRKGYSGRNIKLIEKINLATDRSLWLVELGESYYFLYLDKNGMTKLDKLNKLEINLVETKLDQKSEKKFLELLNKKKKSGDRIDEE